MSESIKINNETLTYNKIWYIDQNNGSDTSGDGSEGNPFQTIQKGIDSQQNGDQLAFYSGIYMNQNNVSLQSYKYSIVNKIDFIQIKDEIVIFQGYGNSNSNGKFFKILNDINFINIIFQDDRPIDSVYIDDSYNFEQVGYNVNFYNCIFYGKYRLNLSGIIKFYNTEFYNKGYNLIDSYGVNGNYELYFYNSIVNIDSIQYTPTIMLRSGDNIQTIYNSINQNQATNISEFVNDYFAISNRQFLVNENFTNETNYIFDDYKDIIQWENQGDPSILNPDGEVSNIGVYGGPFAWGDWLVPLLLNKNSTYYTFDGTSINSLQISSLSKDEFDNNGFEPSLITNDNLSLFQDYNFLTLNSKLYTNGLLHKYDPVITNNLIKSKFININNITFNYTSNNMNIGILISFDNINWNYHNGSDFIIEDINNPTNLNTITEIESLFTNYDSINLNELYFQIIIDPIDDTSSFTLNSIDLDIINDSQLKILLSNEDNMWYGLNPSNELINIDINNMEDIYNYGLSIDKINDIHNSDQNFWNNFQGGTNKIKLQYYLQINDSQEVIELDTLSLQVDINGTWVLQQPFNTETDIGDYNIELSDTLLRVNVYNDGSYKVNYNFIDETPPQDLFNFDQELVSYEGNPQIKLTKTPPLDYDLQGTIIRRKLNEFPSDPYGQDGSIFIDSSKDEIIYDTNNIQENSLYCYTQFPYDMRTPQNINLSLSNQNKTNIQIDGFVPMDGMIAYYPLQNDQNDYSGNDNHGTINGTVTFDGTQQTFDGSSYITSVLDYIPQSTITMNFYNTSDSYSLSGWQSESRYYIGNYNNTQIQNGYGDTYVRQESGTTFTNNWVHLTMVGDGTNLYSYVNGVLIDTTSYNPGSIVNNINFNIGFLSTTFNLNGKISNTRIYNRQLSEEEVYQVYEQDKMN